MDIPAIGPLRHYPELDGKTFLLGVGGMKCATSWVFQYLEQLPMVDVSPVKELHFFNAKIRPPGHEPFTPMLIDAVRSYLEQSNNVEAEIAMNGHFQAMVDCLRMLHDDNAYFSLFARLCQPDTKVVGEITPQYSILGRDGFAYVKDFFASQDMRLKVFLILRDPVDRLWSHLRHLQQHAAEDDILGQWQTLIRKRGVIERSDYWQTIEALDATFPTEDLLYLFYEDLFDGNALDDLCAFMGLPYQPPAETGRRNETAVKTALPDDIREKLLRVLAPQYRFCHNRFGATVPKTWQA